MDDRAAAQIEEIFAHTPIACAPSLPLTNMSKRMLNGYPFAQLSPSIRGLLALS